MVSFSEFVYNQTVKYICNKITLLYILLSCCWSLNALRAVQRGTSAVVSVTGQPLDCLLLLQNWNLGFKFAWLPSAGLPPSLRGAVLRAGLGRCCSRARAALADYSYSDSSTELPWQIGLPATHRHKLHRRRSAASLHLPFPIQYTHIFPCWLSKKLVHPVWLALAHRTLQSSQFCFFSLFFQVKTCLMLKYLVCVCMGIAGVT